MQNTTQPHIVRQALVVLMIVGLALTPMPNGRAVNAAAQNREGEDGGRERASARGAFGDCRQLLSRHSDSDQNDDRHDDGNRRGDGGDEGRGERNRRDREECLPAGSSSGIARGDFNADGFADLAIGVPGESVLNRANAGAVIVIYGSAEGLRPDMNRRPAQLWTQDSLGIPDFPETDDAFGSALASGDFNGDMFSDLAIGVPGEILVQGGIGVDGVVTIIFGSVNGLAAGTAQTVLAPQTFSVLDLDHPFLHQAADTEADVVLGRFVFGASLAWGDFDGDAVGDLAIGAPGANGVGIAGVLFGIQDQGLSGTGNVVFTEGTEFPGGGRQFGDRFGEVLAGGDFNGDRTTDLAIGIPFRDVRATDTQGGGILTDAGVVFIVFGSLDPREGPIETRVFDETTLFRISATRPNPTVGGFSQARALFGRALAAGDFDGNASDDLAMASPLKGVHGRPEAGGVWIMEGPLDPELSDIQFWSQSLTFVNADQLDEISLSGSPSEPQDRFGTALAAGDFNADSREDLAIGVPFEDLRTQTGPNSFSLIADAGAVTVIYGSSVGLAITPRRPQFWTQRFINSLDDAEPDDRFGAKLTAWNFGRNEPGCPGCEPIRTADLAIGVPKENIGNVADAGAVNVIYGLRSAEGLVTTQNPPFPTQFFHQNSPGVPDLVEANDNFGATVY